MSADDEFKEFEFASEEEKMKYKSLQDRFALQREFDIMFVEIAHRIYFSRLYAAASDIQSPLDGLIRIAL